MVRLKNIDTFDGEKEREMEREVKEYFTAAKTAGLKD